MGSSSAAFAVIDALVDQLPGALNGAVVFDGYGDTNEPGDFVMIGVADLFSEQPAVSIDAAQDWAHVVGLTREETGSVNCLAWVSVGDNGEKAQRLCRTRVAALVDQVATHVRVNYSLGVDTVMWVGFELTSFDQDQDEHGAWSLAYFRIHFKARI